MIPKLKNVSSIVQKYGELMMFKGVAGQQKIFYYLMRFQSNLFKMMLGLLYHKIK